jgi:hypothetical protein
MADLTLPAGIPGDSEPGARRAMDRAARVRVASYIEAIIDRPSAAESLRERVACAKIADHSVDIAALTEQCRADMRADLWGRFRRAYDATLASRANDLSVARDDLALATAMRAI